MHKQQIFSIYQLWVCPLFSPLCHSTTLSLPKCGKGKPALVRRNTVDDKSELIACIETGNFAKAARIAAGVFSCTESKILYITVIAHLCNTS